MLDFRCSRYRRRCVCYRLARCIVLLIATFPGVAFGWGALGHAAIAYIAEQHLQPDVRNEVERLLASDRSGLADPDDIGDQANWADRYRDSHGRGDRYLRTHGWHFINLDLRAPDMAQACRGAEACVVDKIVEFRGVLADPAASDRTRLRALQFLLHLVGDVHQPLHASDNGDAGGNDRRVSMKGVRTASLHHYWDTELVERLDLATLAETGTETMARTGPETPGETRRGYKLAYARAMADVLSARIQDADIVEWSTGDPRAWAWEAHRIARTEVYGRLRKPDRKGIHRLTPRYVEHASVAITLQLSRAGIRLADTLNTVLRPRARGRPN